MSEKKILIVEDEPLIAQDIKNCCRRIGYQVIGIAGRSERALDLLFSQPIDAVILDISIQGELDGIQLATIINEKYRLPFIFLTSHSDRGTLDRAKGTLPYGYILKPFDENDLMTALEIAIFKHNNQQSQVNGLPNLARINEALAKKLSEREYQVVEAIYSGLSNQEMAKAFYLSENTIKSHIKRIYFKLGVHNRGEMIKYLLIGL